MWQEVWTAIVSESSDIPDLSTKTRIVMRVVLANSGWRYQLVVQLDNLMEDSR
ncbi:MAG: hypothetical protein KUA43_23370 [Hoeflea sp.]|uniref:hypothetical protein n=1 Tax=Hoeflea sp. TaxID=1940281 RepID=UPI001D646DFE|nr:hypothetical protein [Hoeflea sp.]MBU4532008.1 hypothetical protein [Alphaproteobacteria bacterium]MBU4543253.1 hypothetical protein [Alphaproteobacteria bacterium]MBU4549823.1 hypothetical protein [Alphaproteobacteria bacterium]MBV1726384.1 hypothetical protein [Hoeflea sp.]MBV1786239.1 hypothetical protein [Hoeflea sp.]